MRDVLQLHSLQGFAKKCSGVAQASLNCRNLVMQVRCRGYGDYSWENLLQVEFSILAPFILGANQTLPSL